MPDDLQRRALLADMTRRLDLASHGELRILERALQAIERRRESTETDAPLMAMLFEEMLDIPIRAGAPEAIGLTPRQLRARTAAEVAAEDALRDPQVTARNAARMAERDDIRHDVRHARLRGAMASTEENAERDRRDEVTIGIPGDHWGDTIVVDEFAPDQLTRVGGPEPYDGYSVDDDDERDDPGPHTHVDDGGGECDVCGRRIDQFSDLGDEWDADWDGAVDDHWGET